MTKYEKLIKDFTKNGYEVVEGSAWESVGYAEPTEEFWFTVTIKKSKKKKLETIYTFKANKDVIDCVQMWETKFIITEETKQLF